jgi:hypothetical protein
MRAVVIVPAHIFDPAAGPGTSSPKLLWVVVTGGKLCRCAPAEADLGVSRDASYVIADPGLLLLEADPGL